MVYRVSPNTRRLTRVTNEEQDHLAAFVVTAIKRAKRSNAIDVIPAHDSTAEYRRELHYMLETASDLYEAERHATVFYGPGWQITLSTK